MKLTVERDALQEAFGQVAKSVGKCSNIPILGNILLRAEAGGLTVGASDLDIEARATIPAGVAKTGAITVPARVMTDIVGRSASGAQVSLETDARGDLTLKVGRSRITLQTLPADDFPELKCDEMPTAFEIDAPVFAKFLAKSEFAISTEETRYYLCGTFLHVTVDGEAAKLRAVATDTHRLVKLEMDAPAGAELMRPVIIPRKTVSEIVRIGKGSKKAVVELSEAMMRVSFDGRTVLVSKLIEGTFPDYEKIIPATCERNAVVDREALLEALGRVSAVAGEASISLTLSPDRIEFSTRNPAAGEAVEEMEADYSGDEFKIGFSPHYMRDTLETIDGDQIRAGFDSPGAPGIFEPKTRDGTLLLLMPRRG